MGNCIPLTVVAAAIVAMLVFAAAAGETGDPVEGHRLGIKICAFCHVVAADQEFAPALSKPAPSFQAISNKRGTTAESLQKFISTTHLTIAEPANMPNPQLTEDQVYDLVSYILSLRSNSGR